MDLATHKALRAIGLMLLEDGLGFKLFFVLILFFCCAIVIYNYRD